MNDLKTFSQSVILNFKNAEPAFQPNLVKNLRSDLSNRISAMKISSEKKSFFFHQLTHAHELQDILHLDQLITGAIESDIN